MMKLPMLTATVVVAALVACTGGDGRTATPTSTPAATPSPTAEPSTATVAPSASPAPTAGPGEGSQYGVARVHRNDPDGGLNLRAEPNPEAAIVAVIPSGSVSVSTLGTAHQQGDGPIWFGVTYEGSTGWLNASFLVPLPSFDRFSCGDPATDYSSSLGAVSPVPAPEDADADHVYAIHHMIGPNCERTVITFGRDYSIDADFDLALETAEGVPGEVALATGLGAVRVALPPAVIAAASTASESLRRDNGGANFLFVRPSRGAQFGILGLWDRNRAVRYFYLENPGRLVIDTIDAPTGAGIALGALVSEGPFSLTVLPRPINVDANGPPPEPPIEVVAYSRPFEASATIRLRTVPLEGAAPGSGDPVTADWSGSTFADACGSTYGVMTTDYIEAWGELSFTIEVLAPGTYELFVGEDSAQDGRELGVYHVFTVGGSSAASC